MNVIGVEAPCQDNLVSRGLRLIGIKTRREVELRGPMKCCNICASTPTIETKMLAGKGDALFNIQTRDTGLHFPGGEYLCGDCRTSENINQVLVEANSGDGGTEAGVY